jgi:ankyrin repeat protein
MCVLAGYIACAQPYPEHQTGWTPIIFAAFNDRAEAAAELVRLRADINARNHVGSCLLAFAAPLLLTACTRQAGWTALIRAAFRGHIATATKLVQLGADANINDNVRWMPNRHF